MQYRCTTDANSVYAQGKIYHNGDLADFSSKYIDGTKDKDGKVITQNKHKHWTLETEWVKQQAAQAEANVEAEYEAKNAPAALVAANAKIAELEAAAEAKDEAPADVPTGTTSDTKEADETGGTPVATVDPVKDEAPVAPEGGQPEKTEDPVKTEAPKLSWPEQIKQAVADGFVGNPSKAKIAKFYADKKEG